MLICALLATSSYRSERKEQEAAEQCKIQEQHKEFLSQKDKAAADCIVSIKNDMQDRLSFSSIYYNPTELTVGSGSVLLYFYAPRPYDSFSISDTGNHTLTFRFDRDRKDYVLLENDTVVYTPPAKTDNNSDSDSAGTSGTNGGSPGLHKNDSVVSGKNPTPAPTAKPKQDDFYDVYDYDDPEDFYYDNEDDFDSYEDAEDYYDEEWDE